MFSEALSENVFCQKILTDLKIFENFDEDKTRVKSTTSWLQWYQSCRSRFRIAIFRKSRKDVKISTSESVPDQVVVRTRTVRGWLEKSNVALTPLSSWEKRIGILKRHSNDEVNPNKRINDGIFIVSSVAKLCLLKIKYILLLFQTIKFQKYSNNLFLACRERSGAVKRRVLRCEPSESADRDRVQAERKRYDVVP